MPTRDERAERLTAVLHVLYLIFNEGYTSSFGKSLQRTEFSSEAIRLARAMHKLLPDESEVAGLLALMLLTDARRPARTGARGRTDPAGPAGSIALESGRDRGRCRAHFRHALQGHDRAVSTAGRYRCGSRRSEDLRRHRLATDSGAVWTVETDVRQPDGGAQSRHRCGHGAWPARGAGALETLDADERLAGHYRIAAVRAHLLEMSRRSGRSRRALSRGGRTHDEHP